jgi:hypothetical protein
MSVREVLHSRIEKPRKFRVEKLDALGQIALAKLDGSAVLIPSKRLEGLTYRVTAKGCQCAGYSSHEHCYHEGLRRAVLWLSQWLERESLTLETAVASLHFAKERGGCGSFDCHFCRALKHCPRTANRADEQFVIAASQAA